MSKVMEPRASSNIVSFFFFVLYCFVCLLVSICLFVRFSFSFAVDALFVVEFYRKETSANIQSWDRMFTQ